MSEGSALWARALRWAAREGFLRKGGPAQLTVTVNLLSGRGEAPGAVGHLALAVWLWPWPWVLVRSGWEVWMRSWGSCLWSMRSGGGHPGASVAQNRFPPEADSRLLGSGGWTSLMCPDLPAG